MNARCRVTKSFGAAANALSIPPGEYVRKNETKGIDGDPHKRWSMWFNSKQREEPYQVLTSIRRECNGSFPFGDEEDRWCMVVVSSCREMLG